MMATLLSLGGIMVFSMLQGAPRATEDSGSNPYDYEDTANPHGDAALGILSSTNGDNPDEGIERVSADTIITFEHYQPETSEFTQTSEHPSPFLIGLTWEELAIVLPDWEVLYFSKEHVHLRQDTAFFARQYIISSHQGFLAIFYDNGESVLLKELTSRPISALLPEEQQRLLEGIRVTGNDELMRAMEDFGS